MKRQRSAKAAKSIITVIAAAILLSGCSTATDELKDYTGPAVIKQEQINGKVCFAKVENPDGVQATILMGYRSVCGIIEEEQEIRMENGAYVK